MTTFKTSCGCTWQRVRLTLSVSGVQIGGDVVVVQCMKHAVESMRAERREKRDLGR